MAALEKILQQVKEGTLSIEEASLSLRKAPFVDLGYAQVDTQRGQRQGIPEVIYGAGKTAAQIAGIAQVLKKDSDSPDLITRLSHASNHPAPPLRCVGRHRHPRFFSRAIGAWNHPDPFSRIQ